MNEERDAVEEAIKQLLEDGARPDALASALMANALALAINIDGASQVSGSLIAAAEQIRNRADQGEFMRTAGTA